MLRRVNAQELAELMAYDRIEAGGDYRLLLQIAVLCWMVASALGKKGSKPKLEDFLVVPFDRYEPTPAEVWRKFQAIAAGWSKQTENGHDDRGS